jgi:hypothetical protein
MNTPVSNPIAKLLNELVGLRNGWIDSPTIADVVMWIYEKHGIWIYTDLYGSCWKYLIVKDNSRRTIEGFNSPTEAYEAAIEYTLNRLIMAIIKKEAQTNTFQVLVLNKNPEINPYLLYEGQNFDLESAEKTCKTHNLWSDNIDKTFAIIPSGSVIISNQQNL